MHHASFCHAGRAGFPVLPAPTPASSPAHRSPAAAFVLRRIRRIAAVLLLGAVAGCTHPRVEDAGSPPPPNHALLVEANRSGKWFHARKTRPIWAKLLESDQTVSTIEGPMTARAGDYLCRGEAGDLWPQRAKTLGERYESTDRVDANGWRQFVPRPDAEGVMATVVKRPFTVTTTWGSQTGKAGDYLLKNYRDRNTPFPADVWVVDQKLFRATYERVRN